MRELKRTALVNRTPAEVYRRPTRQSVAESLGSGTMNLVSGRVVDQSGGAAIATAYFQVPISQDVVPGSISLERRTPGPVTLGIRPESVAVSRPGAGDPLWSRVDGRVLGVDRQGDFDWVHVALRPSPARSDKNHAEAAPDDVWLVRATAWSEWREGDDVEVRWHSSNLFCFDPTSGKNLTV